MKPSERRSMSFRPRSLPSVAAARTRTTYITVARMAVASVASTSDDDGGGSEDDGNRDGVFHVAEGVVQGLPVRAERVSGGCEGERPDGAPEEREHGVPAERRSEDARRDRDERAGERGEP